MIKPPHVISKIKISLIHFQSSIRLKLTAVDFFLFFCKEVSFHETPEHFFPSKQSTQHTITLIFITMLILFYLNCFENCRIVKRVPFRQALLRMKLRDFSFNFMYVGKLSIVYNFFLPIS